jgi:hypothetical protein
MQVRELMSRDVQIAAPDETIQCAAARMSGLDIAALPVGRDDRLIGIIVICVEYEAYFNTPKRQPAVSRVDDAFLLMSRHRFGEHAFQTVPAAFWPETEQPGDGSPIPMTSPGCFPFPNLCCKFRARIVQGKGRS